MVVDLTAARFLLVGLGNTLSGLAVIFVAKAFGADDVTANVTGYAIGMALSFVLNKRWAFRHDGPVLPALARFVAVLAVAYAANLAVVLSAIHWFSLDSYVSQALGVPAYAVLSYIGSRRYAFPERQNAAEPSI